MTELEESSVCIHLFMKLQLFAIWDPDDQRDPAQVLQSVQDYKGHTTESVLKMIWRLQGLNRKMDPPN